MAVVEEGAEFWVKISDDNSVFVVGFDDSMLSGYCVLSKIDDITLISSDGQKIIFANFEEVFFDEVIPIEVLYVLKSNKDLIVVEYIE